MADIGKFTVSVSLKVDDRTAETCLRLVEMYVNQTGAEVIGHREPDGMISFEYRYKEST